MKGFFLGLSGGLLIAFLIWKVERAEKVRENALKQAREVKIKALNRYIELLENEIN